MIDNDPLELDRRTRAALLRLRDNPGLAFSIFRELVEIGWEDSCAWHLVEATLNHRSTTKN